MTRPSALALSRRSACGALFWSLAASALGRTPEGGALRLSLPLDTSELDPHALHDPLAALFGPAVTDPLYALDDAGRPYPALAAALPEQGARGALVRLRPGLVTARGKPLSARDVAFSVARARDLGAAGILSPFPAAKLAKDPLLCEFPGAEPRALAIALSSPATAIVPRGFSRLEPDGTGAFLARLSRDGLTLSRNLRAARGPAFLDRIEVTRAKDLAEALRAFESGRSDVGWLGAGLHRLRAEALALAGPVYGQVVLRTGNEAKRWGAAGVAQQLADHARAEELGHLGVTPEPLASAGVPWGGGPAELLVAAEAPQLRQIAEAVAVRLSRPGHELREHALPRAELGQRRAQKRFALMLDFVRVLGKGQQAALLALLTAENPALARRPPRLEGQTARDLTRTLELGVLGGLRVVGAHAPAFRGLSSWQLGAVYRANE